MPETYPGILSYPVHDTPVTVVDLETTGLWPGHDRILEISVVRIDPGRAPRLAFDTLVNPMRPVAATEIHGITDRDVSDAPTFGEVAGDFARAIAGSVLTAYNVYFDISFIHAEFAEAGLPIRPPHLCLMYLRPLLGMGRRCRLHEACFAHKVKTAPAHTGASDALAAAELMDLYLADMRRQGIVTFADLARGRSYKFLDSLRRAPVAAASVEGLPRSPRMKSRHAGAQSAL